MAYGYYWLWKRRARPIATYALIIVNAAVYIVSSVQNLLISISDEWVDTYAYIPVLMYNPEQWYRVLTSMFLHGDIFHIFFNMLFLYWFGRDLEHLLGVKRFLALYLISGVAAVVFHTGFTPIVGSLNLVVPAIGASGAISGLLGAYLMVYPTRRLSVCWFLLFVPLCFTTTAAFFLLFWFATQVIYGYLRFGGIAFFAHIGGFIAGISLIYLLKKRKSAYEWGLWFEPIFESIRPRGLGRVAKVVLFVLLAAVLAGALYSTAIASQAARIYMVNITACEADRCYSGEAVYTPDRVIAPSEQVPRIVFNRFVWSGLMTMCYGSTSIRYSGTVPVPDDRRYSVYIYIEGEGRYDDNCVLVEFKGVLRTQVVHVHPVFGTIVGVGREVKVYTVSLESNDVAGDAGRTIVSPMAFTSSVLTVSSMFVVALKDRDLVEEELLFLT